VEVDAAAAGWVGGAHDDSGSLVGVGSKRRRAADSDVADGRSAAKRAAMDAAAHAVTGFPSAGAVMDDVVLGVHARAAIPVTLSSCTMEEWCAFQSECLLLLATYCQGPRVPSIPPSSPWHPSALGRNAKALVLRNDG